MADSSIVLDGSGSILFVGNSFTFGRVDPVMSYNTDHVRDMTAPVPGTSFEDTTGSNVFEPHPWGGVPGVFYEFAEQAGLTLDVALSTRNAASLEGHYLNSNPAGWDLRGNIASQSWDTVVLQDNSTQALPSGAGSITFAAGSDTARLTLTPTMDAKVETDETVGIRLTGDAAYRVGTSSTVTGTILNDDPTGPVDDPSLPTVTLTASPSAALEDGTDRLVYTFTRTGPTDEPLEIEFGAARDGATSPSVNPTTGDFVAVDGSIYDFQSGGASTAGSVSFTSNSGSVVIAAGSDTATLTLDPKADATVENDESIHLTLKPTTTATYNVGTPGEVSATIVNDDFAPGTDPTQPNITVNLLNSAIYEDDTGALVWEFTRTGSTDGELTVDFGVNGTATLPSGDFTVDGASSFSTAGATDPDLESFQTYATRLAEYVRTGAADGAIPANSNANDATDVFLYETWARPNLVNGALVAETDDVTGEVTTSGVSAPEYYTSLEDMTADLRAAYEGLAAANPIFEGVAPVGAAFLAAVQQGVAIRDPYTETADNGSVNLWWDDNLHASKFGSYLSALTLFGTITGIDPRSIGAGDSAAAELGVDPAVATALQDIAAATVGFSLDAHWTAPGRVTELQGSATGTLASAGAFSFSDANATAVHTVSVSPVTVGAYGALTASLHSDTTGDGSGGAVNWTYTADNADIESLVAGQTREERFLVTLTDQNGDEAEREIVVTLTGVNDGTEDDQNILRGNAGADEFYGLGGDDQLYGKGGDDALYGGYGDDLLAGGAGDDHLNGGRNSDRFTGGDGDDRLNGGKGSDRLDGGAGDDALEGGSGGDVANGGAGRDTFVITSLADGRDEYDGGAGSDTIDFSALSESVDLKLSNGATTYASDALVSIENVTGGSAADRLTGNAVANVLSGNAGDDMLAGGGGDDRLIGGAGNDELSGGGGSDSFVFQSLADGIDTITDFKTTGGAQDQLALSLDLFSGFAGDDPFDLIGLGYLQVVSTGAGSKIQIDADGGGDNFETIAISKNALTNGMLADHTALI